MVVSLCDYSGVMVRPWANGGHACQIVDWVHDETALDGISKVQADVRSYVLPEPVTILFAFPPCTHLAVSGARWFKRKGLQALSEAIAVVETCVRLAEQSRAPYFIENPVGVLGSYWRKPDHIFDPCDYAGYEGGENDTYTKKTCLWVGNGFKMPEPKRIEPTDTRIHTMPPSEDRARLRSLTPAGFAAAVYEANRETAT